MAVDVARAFDHFKKVQPLNYSNSVLYHAMEAAYIDKIRIGQKLLG